MTTSRIGPALLLTALVASPALAQDAVMQTARPLEASTLRLAVHPVLLPEGDDELGLAGRAEWALDGRLAFQSRFALYNDLRFLSAQVLYSLARGGELEIAAVGGVHRLFPDEGEGYYGLDLTLVGSGELGEDLSAFGALDLDREWPPAPFAAITRTYVVAGLELALSDRVQVLTEVGLGLGDDSPNYFSAGLAWTGGD